MKFHKTHMQTLEPKPFFDKVADRAYDFIKKETLAQAFSCECSEIFKMMGNELEKAFSISI